jgi:hypothetical protein
MKKLSVEMVSVWIPANLYSLTIPRHHSVFLCLVDASRIYPLLLHASLSNLGFGPSEAQIRHRWTCHSQETCTGVYKRRKPRTVLDGPMVLCIHPLHLLLLNVASGASFRPGNIKHGTRTPSYSSETASALSPTWKTKCKVPSLFVAYSD